MTPSARFAASISQIVSPRSSSQFPIPTIVTAPSPAPLIAAPTTQHPRLQYCTRFIRRPSPATQLVDFLVEDLQGEDASPACRGDGGGVAAAGGGGGGGGVDDGAGEDAENWESIPIWKIPAEVLLRVSCALGVVVRARVRARVALGARRAAKNGAT